MLTLTKKGKTVKCGPEDETFYGYENETHVIMEMLKSKNITVGESIESAHLNKCNPVTERMWVRTVSRIQEMSIVPNANGTFHFNHIDEISISAYAIRAIPIWYSR